MRLSKTFVTKDPFLKRRLLQWASGKETCCLLDSNRDRQSFTDAYSCYDFILAVDPLKELKINNSDSKDSFDQLKAFHENVKNWLFGYFTYDPKNEIENLSSNNSDHLNFPAMHFFQPRLIFRMEKGMLKVEYLQEFDNEQSIKDIVEEISNIHPDEEIFSEATGLSQIEHRVSKTEYVQTADKIKKHILRGDIYELNYCIEFFAKTSKINPEVLYQKLNEISPMPFSCYYKNDEHHLACASPERFLAKRGNKIISQPMKGTAKRGATVEEDLLFKSQLQKDTKEQSENVMIVDLVRNDLSKTAVRNSVKVEELYGVYTFNQLHQLISTVVSEISDETHWTDVIRQSFPMGSMTGAPKIRAMELIEEYEKTKRGLYSGCVGYVTPDGDFDFNVVIRSILYNEKNNYLSFMAGSAITAKSDAEAEYRECMLKANSMIKAIGATSEAYRATEY